MDGDKFGRTAALGCVLAFCALSARATVVTAVSGRFTVDQTPPSAPVAVEPADAALVTGPFVRLRATATDALSGVADYAFEEGTNSASWRESDHLVLRAPDGGEHAWRCRARDRAGNVSEWSSWSTFSYQFGDDADADGQPDSWETAFFGRLDHSAGDIDTDGDGQTDLVEAEAGTHPCEYHLALQKGWNLLAMPCTPDVESSARLCAAAAGGALWAWDGTAYVRFEQPEPFTGFWLCALAEEQDVRVTGLPPATTTATLLPEWSLVGPGFAGTLLDVTPLRAIWAWQDGLYLRVPHRPDPPVLTPLRGYWVLSLGGDVEFVRF